MLALFGWVVLQLMVFLIMIWCFAIVWFSQKWSGIWKTEDTVCTCVGFGIMYVNYLVYGLRPFTVVLGT